MRRNPCKGSRDLANPVRETFQTDIRWGRAHRSARHPKALRGPVIDRGFPVSDHRNRSRTEPATYRATSHRMTSRRSSHFQRMWDANPLHRVRRPMSGTCLRDKPRSVQAILRAQEMATSTGPGLRGPGTGQVADVSLGDPIDADRRQASGGLHSWRVVISGAGCSDAHPGRPGSQSVDV